MENTIRPAAVAGQFYPASQSGCIRDIDMMLAAPALHCPVANPRFAIVPHAGWIYSGIPAAQAIAAFKPAADPTFIILSPSHRAPIALPTASPATAWQTPLGNIAVDTALLARLRDTLDIDIDSGPHRLEHSIEVQLPIIRRIHPAARIVPILIPASPHAHSFGAALAAALPAGQEVFIIATTDLTHYGRPYGFAPQGNLSLGLEWMKNENDRRFIDLALTMQSAMMVAEAAASRNACGPGAAAAATAAAAALGITSGHLLDYRTSADASPLTQSDVAVGYAAILF